MKDKKTKSKSNDYKIIEDSIIFGDSQSTEQLLAQSVYGLRDTLAEVARSNPAFEHGIKKEEFKRVVNSLSTKRKRSLLLRGLDTKMTEAVWAPDALAILLSETEPLIDDAYDRTDFLNRLTRAQNTANFQGQRKSMYNDEEQFERDKYMARSVEGLVCLASTVNDDEDFEHEAYRQSRFDGAADVLQNSKDGEIRGALEYLRLEQDKNEKARNLLTKQAAATI